MKKNEVIEYLERLKTTAKQASFTLLTDNCTLNVDGKFRKHGTRYSFAKGKTKIIIDRRKSGSLWSWAGTRKEYWIEVTVSGQLLFEFKIPKDATVEGEDEREF